MFLSPERHVHPGDTRRQRKRARRVRLERHHALARSGIRPAVKRRLIRPLSGRLGFVRCPSTGFEFVVETGSIIVILPQTWHELGGNRERAGRCAFDTGDLMAVGVSIVNRPGARLNRSVATSPSARSAARCWWDRRRIPSYLPSQRPGQEAYGVARTDATVSSTSSASRHGGS